MKTFATTFVLVLVVSLVFTSAGASRPVDEGCVQTRATEIVLNARHIHADWLHRLETGMTLDGRTVDALTASRQIALLTAEAELHRVSLAVWKEQRIAWERQWIDNYDLILEALPGARSTC